MYSRFSLRKKEWILGWSSQFPISLTLVLSKDKVYLEFQAYHCHACLYTFAIYAYAQKNIIIIIYIIMFSNLIYKCINPQFSFCTLLLLLLLHSAFLHAVMLTQVATVHSFFSFTACTITICEYSINSLFTYISKVSFFFFSPSSNSVLGIFCTCIETQKNAGVEKLELRMEESLLLNFYLKLYYFTCPSWFLHILISFSYHWTYKILPVS